MEKLRALVDEICQIEGIKPGQVQPDNPEYGELGQLLDNLMYNTCSAWQEVENDEGLRARVTQTAEGYLQFLKQKQAS